MPDLPCSDSMRWLFVYGTLMPGRLRWPLIAADVVRQRPSAIPGTLYDTGHGYPALVVGGGRRRVPGWLLELSERAPTVFEELDVVEGPHYRRTDVTTVDGVHALTYAYIGDPAAFTVLDGPWDRDDER
jgi:gamma-glutamylcyclotransferase (GGCT)/AIG2-like uncharacterized protein YtfP